jgi:ribA/ribD-fused uncharacterized protein
MDLQNLVPGYRHYSMAWLIDEFEIGTQLKYLYFWGHTSNSTDTIAKECFSQWHNSPFTVNEILYKTAEHWMMAQKALLFDDSKTFQQIIQCEKPGEAKDLGRQVIGYDDSVWNKTKYDIVKLGNIHKFNQNEMLEKFLLSTTNRVLVEASPVDKVWGAGISKDSDDLSNLYAWPGLNLLGFALMEVRDILLELGTIQVTSHLLPPPWIQFPGINPNDMFWKMGKGEDHIIALGKQEQKMDEKTRICYFLNNPAPFEWNDYYSD